jgi:membrane-bound lytic murein transglycosylase B
VRCLVAALVACAATTVLAQQPSRDSRDTQAATTPGATAPAATQSSSTPAEPAERPSFTQWLDEVRAEAVTRGIRPDIVEQALGDVTEPVPVVIERDRSQTETVLSIENYLSRQLTPDRLRTGRDMMTKYKDTLDQVSASYGVPAQIISGVWGLESNFGRFSGVRPTIAALATLAWDPRRSAYFRGELFDALQILNSGDVGVSELKGSWAGAMGQPQFMPSSYLQFAKDFDGDGRRDIWSTPADIFASIANYLKGHGWTPGQPWGREVTLASAAAQHVAATVARRTGSCSAIRDMTVALPIAEWRRLGAKTLGGGRLPNSDLPASLVSGTSRHFLVSGNYDALLQYNCAHSYALSVAMLGDRIAAPAATPSRTPARTAPPAAGAASNRRSIRARH